VRNRIAVRETLMLLPLAALFAWLGAWQWQRMHDKQELIAAFHSAPERDYADAVNGELPYVRARVTGSYAQAWHLLRDNRIEAGRVGVHVHTLFQPDHGPAILVNRGWLPLAADRRSLPQIPTPAGRVTLTGLIAPPPDSGVQLGDPESYDRLEGPTLVTYLDMARLAAVLDTDFAPRLLLLDSGDTTGFGARAWQPAVMLPAQHRAYAVQWFALCAATLILWFTLASRRMRSGTRS
jgi:surfeit locus 1 family protein